uniref:5'-nucleotidase domain-containing protein 3-like isoform X2 n=1 Tax=Myxine glutinosa TaxID=7769 RepID=UPI00358FFBD5
MARTALGRRVLCGQAGIPSPFGRLLSDETGTFRECFGQPTEPVAGTDMKDLLWKRYKHVKALAAETWTIRKSLPISPSAVFANNEVCLGDVAVYGFDYDYTLALYSSELHATIYSSAMDVLLEKYKYPKELRQYEYRQDFAIRGLHYDVHKSLLMKIDAFHYIEPGTVHRGLSLVPHEEVQELYEGTHVPLEQMSDFYGKGSVMKQFMDIFSLPEMTLLSSVNDYFIRHNIDYDPVHLYKDVSDAVRDVHVKGLIYNIIAKDMGRYIQHGKETKAVLTRLVDHKKKLFLITNSPYSFVDKGMNYMVGPDWHDLFDVIIVKADKPDFFNDRRRPFRRLADQGGMLWDRITSLRKGEVYKQGNLYEFLRLTGWTGSTVLYFGDHIYSDLADLTLRHGWRTGAIIPELADEINTMNSESFVNTLAWLQTLTALLETSQGRVSENMRVNHAV